MPRSASRRRFLKAQTAAVLATQVPGLLRVAEPAAAARLAQAGGPKAVQAKPAKWTR